MHYSENISTLYIIAIYIMQLLYCTTTFVYCMHEVVHVHLYSRRATFDCFFLGKEEYEL